jgi:hypothetical protein
MADPYSPPRSNLGATRRSPNAEMLERVLAGFAGMVVFFVCWFWILEGEFPDVLHFDPLGYLARASLASAMLLYFPARRWPRLSLALSMPLTCAISITWLESLQ